MSTCWSTISRGWRCLPALLLCACVGGGGHPQRGAPAGAAGAAVVPARAAPATGAPLTPLLITDPAQLGDAVGRQVELVGTARDAKLAAAVLVGPAPVYCTALSSWPAALQGRRVRAAGRLIRTDRYRATVDDVGAIGQGTAGGDLVLEGCRPRLEP